MEQQVSNVEREKISCSICLDVLKDPVTIPCGHSFCINCVQEHWNSEDQRGTYKCPQCRKTFRRRPVLKKNITLTAVVEDLKNSELQAAPADHHYAGPEDVACDVCTGRKMKALKSCLYCPASYCRDHLQPHYDAPPLKKHKLVEPCKNLQQNVCSRHDEVMKVFCCTDQQCICCLCLLDEHKGHETVPAAAERAEKQKELQVTEEEIQGRIFEYECELSTLENEEEVINTCTDEALKYNKKFLREMTRLVQKRCSDMRQQIRSQQETKMRQIKELREKLEQEIPELKRKYAELKKLSSTEDHSQFLLSYPSLPAPVESTLSSTIETRSDTDETKMIEELQVFLGDNWSKPLLTDTEVDILVSGWEPITVGGFSDFKQEINLDPKTANKYLLLSKYNTKVTLTKKIQRYPDHPGRFAGWYQVLSEESLTERHFWEVDWVGESVYVAVSYKDINRAGTSKDCAFGFNDKSWAMHCKKESCTFWHNGIKTDLSAPVASRVGVYLDHKGGLLSFYNISSRMTFLHRVKTTFTQPLHAGIWLSDEGDSAFFNRDDLEG
ncbi:tripartite motif-containing protein 16 [Fundulus heteroclitus]|uniref:tripartite motif-containing protein 16 n=1 Tax=Fundulus heteroclitus TaxID=8078 RepID=UPI00165AB8D0|nr:tripartite motif-containing protein 16 [Fundulus heteroclitus]XP_012712458.2 tripartite motif-containing protein 16 [Fundulus heteroclitus]